MKKNQIIGIVVLLVIIIAAGVIVISHSNSNKSKTSPANTSSSSSSAKSSDSMNSNGSKPVATSSVNIKDFMFMPSAVTVKAGTTVTWTNQDSVAHTVTADNPSSDAPASMSIAQGKSFSYTFNKAGTYTYHCTPHPYMHGTVIVTN